jgi:hypothetical protein
MRSEESERLRFAAATLTVSLWISPVRSVTKQIVLSPPRPRQSNGQRCQASRTTLQIRMKQVKAEENCGISTSDKNQLLIGIANREASV